MIRSKPLKGKQQGTFIIECVLAMSVLTLLVSFTIEMVSIQNLHSRLHQLAYSGAMLIRERDALFNSNRKLSFDDVNNLFRVLNQSLSRTYGDYAPNQLGLYIEQATYHASSDHISAVAYNKGIDCRPQQQLRSNRKILSNKQDITIYQVVLCHNAESFYSRILARSGTIQATMLMPER